MNNPERHISFDEPVPVLHAEKADLFFSIKKYEFRIYDFYKMVFIVDESNTRVYHLVTPTRKNEHPHYEKVVKNIDSAMEVLEELINVKFSKNGFSNTVSRQNYNKAMCNMTDVLRGNVNNTDAISIIILCFNKIKDAGTMIQEKFLQEKEEHLVKIHFRHLGGNISEEDYKNLIKKNYHGIN